MKLPDRWIGCQFKCKNLCAALPKNYTPLLQILFGAVGSGFSSLSTTLLSDLASSTRLYDLLDKSTLQVNVCKTVSVAPPISVSLPLV